MPFFRAFMKYLIAKMILLLILLIIYIAVPLFIMMSERSHIKTSFQDILPADSAIVFGAHLTAQGEISEILRQRLEAGRMLYHRKLVPELVTSNTREAAYVMRDYLVAKKVSDKAIFVDTFAERTPDSCQMEKQRFPKGRKVIFVSQGFHLPRLLYQCRKVGVEGIGLAAEEIFPITSHDLTDLEKISIKFDRYFRESYLIWAVILDVYS